MMNGRASAEAVLESVITQLVSIQLKPGVWFEVLYHSLTSREMKHYITGFWLILDIQRKLEEIIQWIRTLWIN